MNSLLASYDQHHVIKLSEIKNIDFDIWLDEGHKDLVGVFKINDVTYKTDIFDFVTFKAIFESEDILPDYDHYLQNLKYILEVYYKSTLNVLSRIITCEDHLDDDSWLRIMTNPDIDECAIFDNEKGSYIFKRFENTVNDLKEQIISIYR